MPIPPAEKRNGPRRHESRSRNSVASTATIAKNKGTQIMRRLPANDRRRLIDRLQEIEDLARLIRQPGTLAEPVTS